MPLYRTAVLLRRFGGDIVSNTLAAGVVRIGLAVQPIINLLRDHLWDSELIYGDETTVQVLKEPGRKAQTKSFMWAQMNGSGPPVRLFAYAPGRGAVHAQKLYAGIRRGATLVTDGYQVYDGIAENHGLTHLGCCVHVRRPFVEAEEAIPKAARSPDQLATRFIKLIGKLYRAEALAKDWTSERRQRLRQRYSAAVVKQIEQLLLKHRWTPLMALRRHRRWCERERQSLFTHRDGQGQQRRAVSLPRRPVQEAATGANGRGLRGPAALATGTGLRLQSMIGFNAGRPLLRSTS